MYLTLRYQLKSLTRKITRLESADGDGKGTRQAIHDLRKEYMRQQYPKLCEKEIEHRAETEPLRHFPDDGVRPGSAEEDSLNAPAFEMKTIEEDDEAPLSNRPFVPKVSHRVKEPTRQETLFETAPSSRLTQSTQNQESSTKAPQEEMTSDVKVEGDVKKTYREKFAEKAGNLRQLSFSLTTGEEVCPVVPMSTFGPLQSPPAPDFPDLEKDDFLVTSSYSPRYSSELPSLDEGNDFSFEASSGFSSPVDDGSASDYADYFPIDPSVYRPPSPVFQTTQREESGFLYDAEPLWK